MGSEQSLYVGCGQLALLPCLPDQTGFAAEEEVQKGLEMVKEDATRTGGSFLIALVRTLTWPEELQIREEVNQGQGRSAQGGIYNPQKRGRE